MVHIFVSFCCWFWAVQATTDQNLCTLNICLTRKQCQQSVIESKAAVKEPSVSSKRAPEAALPAPTDHLCALHCALCNLHCALCSVHCVLYTVHCALCNVHYALCTVHCTVHCAVHTVHCALWTVYFSAPTDPLLPTCVHSLLIFTEPVCAPCSCCLCTLFTINIFFLHCTPVHSYCVHMCTCVSYALYRCCTVQVFTATGSTVLYPSSLCILYTLLYALLPICCTVSVIQVILYSLHFRAPCLAHSVHFFCVHSKGYVVNYSFFNWYVFISSFAAVMEIRDMNVIQQQ